MDFRAKDWRTALQAVQWLLARLSAAIIHSLPDRIAGFVFRTVNDEYCFPVKMFPSINQ
jgi:hypothetical protein